MELKTSSIIKRYEKNPILSNKDIPYQSSLVFNAGVIKFKGKYIMIFRNDYFEGLKFSHTNLGLAYSNDGIDFKVESKPCLSMETAEISRAYDPRLTVIDDTVYMCFAVDSKHGVRGGIATTKDFIKFDILSLSVPDNRNMVLFPEKVNGKFVRLERPFPVYSRREKERFDIWLSVSPDCRFWGESELVLGVEDVPFSNSKIGPAAPPIKTKYGWLTTFHAVDVDVNRKGWGWEKNWNKRYTAGIMLLDLKKPSKVIGISREPLIVPEAQYEYEAKGFRDFVIFPGGMILEDTGEVKIYYGAADSVTALATAKLDDLLDLCKPV